MFEAKLIEDIVQNEIKEVILYPVTLAKFLLNMPKISSFFENNETDKFEIELENCQNCKSDLLCRKHTSISRIVNETGKVAYDLDTDTFLLKNEIWKAPKDDRKLKLVYCPHTKLMQGQPTSSKVKKVSFIVTKVTEEIYSSLVDKYSPRVVTFRSSSLSTVPLKFWINEDFTGIVYASSNLSSKIFLELNK